MCCELPSAWPLSLSSVGPYPSKSTGVNSEMHIHHSSTHDIPLPAATITSKGQRCLHSRLQKAFQARTSGKLQHGNPGKELWRGKGDRLVCADHCWVVAGHQTQKLFADMWRQGPDVERSQGSAGPSPPRGEQGGNGPLDSMQQSHHGYLQLPRSTMNLGLPPPTLFSSIMMLCISQWRRRGLTEVTQLVNDAAQSQTQLLWL